MLTIKVYARAENTLCNPLSFRFYLLQCYSLLQRQHSQKYFWMQRIPFPRGQYTPPKPSMARAWPALIFGALLWLLKYLRTVLRTDRVPSTSGYGQPLHPSTFNLLGKKTVDLWLRHFELITRQNQDCLLSWLLNGGTSSSWWNELPTDIRTAESLYIFRRKIQTHISDHTLYKSRLALHWHLNGTYFWYNLWY